MTDTTHLDNPLDRYDGLGAVLRPIGWRDASPQPTMRQKRRRPARVEHLQRESTTLRRTHHDDTSTVWVVIEKPTYVLTYNVTSSTYVAVVGAQVSVIGTGVSEKHFDSMRRIFLNMLP